MNTSFSALDTFRTCPLKYKFQQIDKIKTPKSPEAVFGSLLHSTLKFIHEGNFALPTQKDALSYFSSNWNGEVFPDEVQERMAFAQGIKIIQDYFKKNDPTKAQIIDLESRFTIEIKDQNQAHLISGFIDRIDKTEDGFEIIDYKTSRKLPSQDMVDGNLQLIIYLMAFLKRYPQERDNLSNVKLSLYFLKHGVKLSTTITPAQLEKEQLSVLELIHQIEQSDFPAAISPLCGWCGFQKNCPMWKHKFIKTQNLRVKSQKLDILKEYVELSNKIKQDKKRIMELSGDIFEIMEEEKAERLFADGSIIAKSSRKTYEYDEEQIKKVLLPKKLWENVLKLDQTKLKKVTETLPSLEKKLIEEAKKVSKETISLTLKQDKEGLVDGSAQD